ncbi:MAG: helix-hairpin-helix domain-containing protein [PVC group bacterium]
MPKVNRWSSWLRLGNLTRKEKAALAVLGAAFLWGLAGGGRQVWRSYLRSVVAPPALSRELREALPDPEFLAFRSRPPAPGPAATGEAVYLTRPLLPGDDEIETAEDGWIFFPRHYYTTVNINEADLDELTTLPGIGPVTARRILEYRDRYVGFIKLKSLKKVKGIGEKTLRMLEGRVRLY